MSDDWKVGDLALCVDGEPYPPGTLPTGLKEGGLYTVLGKTFTPDGVLLLVVSPPPDPMAFNCRWPGACRFRKIRPDEHEDCEPEFIELLKRSKRKVSA